MLDGSAQSVGSSLPITPIFVLPYKRYASLPLLEIASSYLDDSELSLRKSVRQKGNDIVYADSQDGKALSHTTLARWLTFLGAMTVALTLGTDLFMQAQPASTLHRFAGLVDPRKARSELRQKSLSIARRLLYLRSRWDEVFSKQPFFPRFATGCRSP